MKLKNIFMLGATVCLCAACSQDEGSTSLGRGNFALTLTPDYETTPVLRSASAVSSETPSPDEFAIRLTKDDGTYSKEWSSLANISSDATYSAGSYTLYAYHGAVDDEGFDSPFYEGEAQFSIRDGETTPVEVVATLGQVKVSIEYTDAFRNYFTAYETTVRSEGGANIVFAQDETRSAYVRPGNISLKLQLTKANGIQATYEPARIMGATARQHYIVTFDVSESVGVAQVTITFDSTTETEPITIDVSDEAMTAPAPYFVLEGIQEGETLQVQECESAPNGTLGAMVTARGGLAGCTLQTQSTYLQSIGFPAEVELTELTAEQRALFESVGLTVKGFDSNRDKMGYIDFTGLIPHLQIASNGDADHTFTISARDVNGKSCETPATFTIHNTALQLALADLADITLGDTHTTVALTFDGQDIASLQLLAQEGNGAWNELTYSVASHSGSSYSLTAQLPVSNAARNIKAIYKGTRETEVKTLGVVAPAYSLTSADNEVWSSRATVHVVADEAARQDVIEQYITLYTQSGNTWQEATYTTSSRGYNVTGLSAGTTCRLRGTCLADASDLATSNILEFTTEAATALPNGTFDSWNTWFSETINKGGRYGKVAGWQQETALVEASDPDGWATVNSKTVPTSPSTKNTWYMVPSTLPTTGVSGNGAMLRNVAWDNAGSTPPQGTWGSLTQSLSSLTPPTIANRSAGKLFLGSYSYDHASGTEVYNEGIAFTSRPNKLTGYYKYTAVGNDANGVVTVTVEHRDNAGSVTILATRTLALAPTTTYTAFEVPLAYTNTDYKATHLRVMFASSNNASTSQSEENSAITTTDNRANAVSLGSELYIDNIALEY